LVTAGGLLGYWHASRVSPVYEAKAQLVVEPRTGDIGARRAAIALVPTYAELVSDGVLLEPTLKRLRLPLLPADLRDDVRGEAGNARVLTIRVRNRDPALAATLANALAGELVRHVSTNREGVGGPGAQPPRVDVRLRILERASKADRVQPQRNLAIEFGALAGLFGALALAALVGSSSRKVTDERDLARFGPAVLGSVNGEILLAEGSRSRRRAKKSTHEFGLYRALAARLADERPDGAPRSLLVLGAQGGAGSGAVAINLAAAIAGGGSRVVVAELGREREAARLVLFKGSSRARPKRLPPIQHLRFSFERFLVGPSGALVLALPRASDLRAPSVAEARSLVDLLLAESDFLVVHATTLARSPNALIWARVVEATLLVARREHTRRDRVAEALESLELAQPKVVATVLHETRRS
jgi:receptor protein-tyrosine kinase